MPSAGLAFQVLKHPGLRIAEKAELGQIAVLEEIPGLFGIARIDVDSDDSEFVAAELALQAIQRRHFLAARHAPGRPQIQQNRASLPVRQLFRLAVPSSKARSGICSGLVAMVSAATSPVASGAIFSAVPAPRRTVVGPCVACRSGDPINREQSGGAADQKGAHAP